MITASEFQLKRRQPVERQTIDEMLRIYLIERRRALLTELIALERLLGLQSERKVTIDKS